jgi:hypothetical protein
MRTTDGKSAADVSAAFDGFLTQFSAITSLITIIGLEVALINTNVRNPAVWGGDPSYGSGTPAPNMYPVECTFVGRSALGHKARVSVYGYDGTVPSTFRGFAAESVEIQNTIDTLQAFVGCWRAIDGNTPVWKPYCNVGYNDHWVKNQRTSGI